VDIFDAFPKWAVGEPAAIEFKDLNRSTLRSRQFERILLIKPSAVGDVIHTVPVLAKLRARYPKARIDWLLTPAIAEFIGHHPALSKVVPFDRQTFSRFGRRSGRLATTSLSICMANSVRHSSRW
jgi:hypothetical protein